jgi:type I restriction enzyme M protein
MNQAFRFLKGNLPAPGVIALEIAEDLEAALDQFSQIAADLKK